MTAAGLRWVALCAPAALLFILPFAHVAPWRLGLLIAASLAAVFLWKQTRPRRVPCRVFFIAWILFASISVGLSINPAYSLGEWRNELVYPAFAFASFYVITYNKTVWITWVRVLVAGALVLSLYGLWSSIRQRGWSPNWIGDPNAFSTYIVLLTPLLLYTFTRIGNRVVSAWIGGAVLTLLIACGHLTLNRMMWPTLAAMLVVFFVLYRRKVNMPRRTQWLARLSLIAACAVFTVLYLAANHLRYSDADSTIAKSDFNISRDPRPQIWRFALTKIQERPWTGFGFGRGILRDEFQAHFKEPLYWHGHNIFVNAALEAGIPGMLALICLFAALAYEFLRLYRIPNSTSRSWAHSD